MIDTTPLSDAAFSRRPKRKLKGRSRGDTIKSSLVTNSSFSPQQERTEEVSCPNLLPEDNRTKRHTLRISFHSFSLLHHSGCH